MQDFDNDNYNRNPYAKNTDGNAQNTANDEKTDKTRNADDAVNDENGKYSENYQKAQETQSDDNPYADYYVHKSNGYIPPESNGSSGNNGGQKDGWNASDNSYGNPYDKENGAFGGADMPEQKKGRGMAIASMVLGIVSIILCCCGNFVTVTLALIGLILGIVSQAQKSNGIAIAGIITSAFGLVFGIIGVALMFAGINGDWGDWSDIIVDPNFPFGSDDYKPFPPDENNQAAISDILFSMKLFLGL